jgi:hypothetical protein
MPAASITGRIVDADGRPAKRVEIELRLKTDADPSIADIEIIRRYSNDTGQFELSTVPAGGPYWLAVGGEGIPSRIIKHDFELTAGQTLQLGEVNVTTAEPRESKRP